MVLYIYAAIHASTHEAHNWRVAYVLACMEWALGEARRRRVHAGAWGGVIGLYTPPGSGPRDPQSYNEQHASASTQSRNACGWACVA